MEVTFDARFLEFGLGSFGALCKIYNFTIFKLWSCANFHPIHANVIFIQGILIMGQYRLFLFIGNLPKIKKKMWHFANTGQYSTGNFKVLFLPQFSFEHI